MCVCLYTSYVCETIVLTKSTFLPFSSLKDKGREDKQENAKVSGVLIALPLYKKEKMEWKEIIKAALGNY